MKAYKESALSFQTLSQYLEDGDTREARGRTEGEGRAIDNDSRACRHCET
jgi:hypothetical protein